MKKIKRLALLVLLSATLGACASSPVNENLGVAYQESCTIENEKLQKYSDIEWTSEDEAIATVDGSTIKGIAPGEVKVNGTVNGKTVAVYNVSVSIIPATSIILSTNNLELTQEDVASLTYKLLPDNASDYEFVWKSADDNIASITENGKITANNVGQTTVYISNPEGITEKCTVTVKEKSAYARLSEQEKSFTDLFLKYVNNYKNPSSIKIKYLAESTKADNWFIVVTGQNGFGGNTTVSYEVSKEHGLVNMGTDTSVASMIASLDKGKYDLSLINEAVQDSVSGK